VDAEARWRVLRAHVEDHVPLAVLARDCGIGVRTLQRWHARYRTGGYTNLDGAPRADTGRHRLPADLITMIEALALTRPRPTIATLHRTVAGICGQGGWPVPSYGVVRSVVRALDPGMVTLALEGPASYRDKYELALRRQADRPNAMWQSDHTMLDIVVVGADGEPVRPWLTTILDDCSRAICGYTVFVGAPSAMNTALALRQAIWHKAEPGWPMCGIPDVLYVDHGSDFTSDHLTRTTIDLHIRLIHSAVARPQGRGKVERFFGTVNTELLAALPGHLRPHAAWPTPTLSLAELDTAMEGFVTTYNDRTHSELGVSPHTAWIADGWLPRMPESLEELDEFLLTVARSRVVRRDGIHFQGQRYISPTLAGYVGRSVLIRYDPRDITEIRVFDHDQFVCPAIDQDHHDQKVSLKDIQTARNTRRRALRQGINERIAVLATHPLQPAPPENQEPAPAPGLAPKRKLKLKVYKEDLS
jgi:putative transposase